jgi:hypothetical protein
MRVCWWLMGRVRSRGRIININYSPRSLMAFIIAVSFLAWLASTLIRNDGLGRVASTVFFLFLLFYLLFLIPTIQRNIRSMR